MFRRYRPAPPPVLGQPGSLVIPEYLNSCRSRKASGRKLSCVIPVQLRNSHFHQSIGTKMERTPAPVCRMESAEPVLLESRELRRITIPRNSYTHTHSWAILVHTRTLYRGHDYPHACATCRGVYSVYGGGGPARSVHFLPTFYTLVRNRAHGTPNYRIILDGREAGCRQVRGREGPRAGGLAPLLSTLRV